MNALARLLAKRIAQHGPMTVADFMAEALGHPKHGYYMKQEPFGAEGDFITAPEISQMFGELIGLWCVDVWDRLGRPAPFNLVEIGPGRGTLIVDALRAATVVPDFRRAAQLQLVETSPRLREIQRDALSRGAIAWRDVSWRDGFDQIPAGPCIVVANEFFDALPAHQFEQTAQGWRERLVGLAEGDVGLGLTLAQGPTPALFLLPESEPQYTDAAIGEVVEIQPAALTISRAIGERIAENGGAALFIDYGHGDGRGDSLQAVRRHAFHDVLQAPGEADLTVHVNFADLRRSIGDQARCQGPVGQGSFLTRLGLGVRMEMLMKSASAAQTKALLAAHQRLTDPDQMGALFKAFGVSRNGAASLPGFDEEFA
jgi:NADH dehydrogenase [ubiquinone] 1 alpha subcomplex assembly factor 7